MKQQYTDMRQAGRTLLDQGAKVGIKWLGRERMFTIRPLKLGTIIKISKYAESLQGIDQNDAVASMLKSGNFNKLCKVAACGFLNSRFKLQFVGVFAWWLRFKLTPKELLSIALVIAKQMSVDDFFFTTRLIGGVSLLMTKDEAEKQFGEASQSQQNPSDIPSTI